jgi:hypothetical protein
MRRKNPSRWGRKPAGLGIDRVLQRIVYSSFTAGVRELQQDSSGLAGGPALPKAGVLEVGRIALLVLL